MDERARLRIGDGERQATVDALTAHREAGRLDPVEFEERQVAAARARTWAEVAPLFSDLPQPHPAGMPVVPPPAPLLSQPPLPAVGSPGEAPAESSSGVLGGVIPARYRDTVMALTPLLAVVLFFVTRTWLWFLVIPIVAVLLYGADGEKDRKRDRQRRRNC